jgi:hypothetical protein
MISDVGAQAHAFAAQRGFATSKRWLPLSRGCVFLAALHAAYDYLVRYQPGNGLVADTSRPGHRAASRGGLCPFLLRHQCERAWLARTGGAAG